MTHAELRARVLRAARAEPSPARGTVRLQAAALWAAATGMALWVFFVFGGLRAAPRPEALIAGTALGAACIALAAAWVTLGRGGSMLGRPTPWLAGAALLTPAVLFVWKVVISLAYSGMMTPWPGRPGLRCLGLSLAMGAWPLAAGLWIRRRGEVATPPWAGAGLGVMAGAATWVLVDLWCPVAYVPHLLLGHVLPFALLTGLGALIGARVLGIRAAQPRPAAF